MQRSGSSPLGSFSWTDSIAQVPRELEAASDPCPRQQPKAHPLLGLRTHPLRLRRPSEGTQHWAAMRIRQYASKRLLPVAARLGITGALDRWGGVGLAR